jgi:hypothetical protein
MKLQLEPHSGITLGHLGQISNRFGYVRLGKVRLGFVRLG